MLHCNPYLRLHTPTPQGSLISASLMHNIKFPKLAANIELSTKFFDFALEYNIILRNNVINTNFLNKKTIIPNNLSSV